MHLFSHISEAEAPEQSQQQEVQVAQPGPGIHRWGATLFCLLCTFWRRVSQTGSQLGLGRSALIYRRVLFINISNHIPDSEAFFCCFYKVVVKTWLNRLSLSVLQVQCSSRTTLWPCACWAAHLPPPWPAHLPPCSPSSSQGEEPVRRLVPGRGSRRCSRSSTKPSRTVTTEPVLEPRPFRPPSDPSLPRSPGSPRTVSLSGRPS